jgi:hypothetical protein
LRSAERELSAFLAAVKELFGPEQASISQKDWLDEAELNDSLPLGIRSGKSRLFPANRSYCDGWISKLRIDESVQRPSGSVELRFNTASADLYCGKITL